MSEKPKKVLVIGSGPIVIGQAAEFDYAGTQACKSLREEGVYTVLVNSNPATIMTDRGIADAVYIEPLTVDVVDRIIAKEKPDGILPTLGGQTGLNLAVDLAAAGSLERHGVRLLGTSLNTIRMAEDREEFRKLLVELGNLRPRASLCLRRRRRGTPTKAWDCHWWSAPLTRWEAPAAAWFTARSGFASWRGRGWMQAQLGRCCWSVLWRDGGR